MSHEPRDSAAHWAGDAGVLVSLIVSDRHTAADLQEWSRNERLDEINARRWRDKLDAKARKASDDMVEFAALDSCYAGCSWGKDSTALAHILATLGPAVPVVWVRVQGAENPDCPLVRDAFLSRWPLDYHEIDAPPGKRRTSAAGFDIAAERFGDRHISGVRSEEANYRALRMRKHGVSTARTCAPLGWWSTAEIFAYMHLHDLPVHPAYAMTGGRTWAREHRRVGAIGGERGTGWGRRDWERNYYPEALLKAGRT